MQRIKALGFDVFGTVVNWRDSVAREAAAFFEGHGRRDIDPLRFADAWRARYAPAMQACREAGRPFTLLTVLHRENLDAVLDEVKFDRTQASPAELDAFNDAWERLNPWPDVVAGLTRLKTRFIIFPISNGNISLMLRLSKYAGLPWDAILGAEIAQAYKPSPEVYRRHVELLGVAPAELCMVAAHNGDLRAARNVGLSTAFVVRPTEHGQQQHTDLAAESDWNFNVDSLEDLATQLGC